MSRIGKKPVRIPEKVKVAKTDSALKIEGPNGKAEHKCSAEFDYSVENNEVKIMPKASLQKNKRLKALYGMERAMVNSKITGAAMGFSKTLLLKGVGYRVQAQGKKLNFTLGYSHPIVFDLPEGVKAAVDQQTKITLSGMDKQAVGQTAAKIKMLRPPEPYKGKGIMYENEHIRRKAGKSAAGAKGAK